MQFHVSTGIRRTLMVTGMAALLVLAGCKSEVYQGLTEAQANAMMNILMKNGIHPEKESKKAGYTLSVESDKVVQTLELMRENNLPRADFESLGQVFAAKGMISSATEEQARLAYALSQELADTFSRIDGVLTSRVHVVLGSQDMGTGKTTPPSAAVFLRHNTDSQASHLVSRIRELTANAIPGLKQDNVSVMLVPVRETLTAPSLKKESAVPEVAKLPLIGAGVLALLAILGLIGSTMLYLRASKKDEPNEEAQK